jgi:hypothetical protein
MFMNNGCDSNFEGEIVWYKPIHTIFSKLLDGAGSSVIEFINIPIKQVTICVVFMLTPVTMVYTLTFSASFHVQYCQVHS